MTTLKRTENRPWTFGGRAKSTGSKLRTPQIDTYIRQIQRCQELYAKLELDNTTDKLITSPFPTIQRRERDRTFLSLPTARVQTNNNIDSLSQSSNSTDGVPRIETNRRKSVRMTPKKLCEYLKSKGLGKPRILTSYMKGRNETVINRQPTEIVKMVQRSPDVKRQKAKEKSKQQFNLANIKASAFIEEYDDTVLKSASENMSDKNALLLDRTQHGLVAHPKKVAVGNVNSHSIKSEQTRRIEQWLDEVERATKDNPFEAFVSDTDHSDIVVESISLQYSSSKQLTTSTSELESVLS